MAATTAHKLRVLFVDDEQSLRDLIKMELPRSGYDVVVAEDGLEAIRRIDESRFDAAIIDLKMPNVSGWDVIDHIRKTNVDVDVIISTGHGDMDAAIQAIRRGAYDFLQKPAKLFEIRAVLARIAEKRSLANKAIALETRLRAVEGSSNLIGTSPSMSHVKRLIEKIAPTDSSVLVLGETGTGKELVARRIHELSRRKEMPFVAVNCGALPDNLVESELFGHRKGAFTGADSQRKGLIEVANGGTLFLDELGELDKSMQVKLLRFLESGEVRRVGENEAFHVDVRIVCATNRDLEQRAREGEFREDLYFRVNTFEIHLPPLRERKEDIPALAISLIARHLKRRDVPSTVLTPGAKAALLDYDWQGNVRELTNALEHAVILADGAPIEPQHLPNSVLRRSRSSSSAAFRREEAAGAPRAETSVAIVAKIGSESTDESSAQNPPVAPPSSTVKTLRELEMEAIHRALEKNRGDKHKTAQELGISIKTLYNKLNADQLKPAVPAA